MLSIVGNLGLSRFHRQILVIFVKDFWVGKYFFLWCSTRFLDSFLSWIIGAYGTDDSGGLVEKPYHR